MKPGGSAHPLMDGVTPLASEQVIMGKLHLPALGAPVSPADICSPGQGSFFPPITCLLLLPSPLCPPASTPEALGWPRGGTKDSSGTGSVGQREGRCLPPQ